MQIKMNMREKYEHSPWWRITRNSAPRGVMTLGGVVSDGFGVVDAAGAVVDHVGRYGLPIVGPGYVIGCRGHLADDFIVADVKAAALLALLAVMLARDGAILAFQLVRWLSEQKFARVRRPFYYARENRRRRILARERRQIRRRTTLNQCPTAEDVREAWKLRKMSAGHMIKLAGMIQDLECYVDNTLRITDDGEIVGRNGGIREWLFINTPELYCHYKRLMAYKAMAKKLRQAAGIADPIPTDSLLLREKREFVAEILGMGDCGGNWRDCEGKGVKVRGRKERRRLRKVDLMGLTMSFDELDCRIARKITPGCL